VDYATLARWPYSLPAHMNLTLYVVHGSHPCAAVEKALELKSLSYRKVEWPPPLHAPIQRALFGARTVPGLKISNNGSSERISGSRAIMRRLEQLAPQPPLFPSDPDERRAVDEAEGWGDEVFQPVARTLVWTGMGHSPSALVSYGEGSTIPLSAPAIRLSAPVIARLERGLNRAGDEAARRDLRLLPGYLDRIDAWIADGTIGDAQHPNAADLQIASTIRLLMTLADVRPELEGRPCAELARALFPVQAGEMPAGSLPRP
jgi:glutathione S-transferase